MFELTVNKAGFCVTTGEDGFTFMGTGTIEEARKIVNNRRDQVPNIEMLNGSFMAADSVIEEFPDADKEVGSWKHLVKLQSSVFLFFTQEDFLKFMNELQKKVAEFK